MKKSKLNKLVEKVRRFLDEGYNKKLKDGEDVLESLQKMKQREQKLKEKLAKEADTEEIKKLSQELEIIRKLRKKAKELLAEMKNNKKA
jgi:flagellar biosynthesis component FlhA